MRLFFGTLLLLLFYTNTSFGQIEKDTLVAYQYYQKADSFKKKASYSKAISFYKKALSIYERNGYWKRVVNCYTEISSNQLKTKHIESSHKNTLKAIEICEKNDENLITEKTVAYDNLGRFYVEIRDIDKAIEIFQKSLKTREKLYKPPHEYLANSYHHLAFAYMEKYNLKLALKYGSKSLAMKEEIYGSTHVKLGPANNTIGTIYIKLGHIDKGIEHYNKFLNILINSKGINHLHVGDVNVNIGVSYKKINQLDKALKHYKKALPIFLYHKNNFGLQILYKNMGNVLRQLGKNEKALLYYEKTLRIIDLLDKKYQHYKIRVYNSIGNVYADQEDYEKAINFYNRGLYLNTKYKNIDEYDLSIIYECLGLLSSDIGEQTKALDYLNKAIEIKKKLFGQKDPYLESSYLNIARIYSKQKRYDKAMESIEKSLLLLKGIYGEKHTENTNYLLANSLLEKAILHKDTEEFEKALLLYDKILLANSKSNTITYSLKEDYKSFTLLSKVLNEKSNTQLLSYLKNKKSIQLENCISTFKEADKVIDRTTHSYQSYNDKIVFAKQAKETYKQAIKAQLLHYRITTSFVDFEQAFYYVEKNKSNILKGSLNDSYSKAFLKLPTEFLKIEKKTKSDFAYIKSQVFEVEKESSIDSFKIKKLENKLFDLAKTQDSLTQVLEKNYPKYHQLKYQNKTISVEAIQQKIATNTILLEFFVADSTTYTFTISKNNYSVKELPTPELEDKIKAFREATTSKNVAQYKKLGVELYTTLIKPVKEELAGKELIIVPDGPLWHLNFDLLLTKDTASMNPADFPYLLKDYAISYANSATLLFQPFEEQNSKNKQEGCLAFSFSDSTNIITTKNMSLATLRDTGDDLPGTRKEIKAISEIVNGQYFFGSDADEATFKKNASNYKILHLALHGDVDNERPENSKLYFTKTNDTIEDNYLYNLSSIKTFLPDSYKLFDI